MMELENILLTHKEKYPLAQPADYIKLVFQNEFGPGHLIKDAQISYMRLKSEIEEFLPAKPQQAEDIGNGFVRFYLKGLNLNQNNMYKLNSSFVKSAEHKGDNTVFLQKLECFLQLVQRECFGFSVQQAENAVREYLQNGVRPVSHSQIYRENYTPSYRVIKKEFLDILRQEFL